MFSFPLQVDFHLSCTFLLSTALARLKGLSNSLRKIPKVYMVPCQEEFERALNDLVTMVSVFAPMYAAELRQGLGRPSTAVSMSLRMQMVLHIFGFAAITNLQETFRKTHVVFVQTNHYALVWVKMMMPSLKTIIVHWLKNRNFTCSFMKSHNALVLGKIPIDKWYNWRHSFAYISITL